MRIITINGDQFKTPKEFHVILKRALSFPEYYGENLDALWDCLIISSQLPLKLIWNKVEKSKLLLGDYCQQLIHVFDEAEKENVGFCIEYN
ncbi:MAG: barstar family protein [Mucilaginibacter sp.]